MLEAVHNENFAHILDGALQSTKENHSFRCYLDHFYVKDYILKLSYFQVISRTSTMSGAVHNENFAHILDGAMQRTKENHSFRCYLDDF